jgi:cyanate permease
VGNAATRLAGIGFFMRTFIQFDVPVALTKNERTILTALLLLFLLGLLGMLILEDRPGEVHAVSGEIVSEPLPSHDPGGN